MPEMVSPATEYATPVPPEVVAASNSELPTETIADDLPEEMAKIPSPAAEIAPPRPRLGREEEPAPDPRTRGGLNKFHERQSRYPQRKTNTFTRARK